MIERFAQMPSALRKNARWARLGASGIPALLVHPSGWEDRSDSTVVAPPVVIWLHGRTVSKELDPGRYLRWMRAGIGACAIDLPGHGERSVPELQSASCAFGVVTQAIHEIDEIVEEIKAAGEFDSSRLAIGGVSAGGMATLARLCRPHPFRCASVEATTGSWLHQSEREMFRDRPAEEIAALDPIRNLGEWREIPLQALHARGDEWVPLAGQQAFIDALRTKYADPSLIEFVVYDRTGAPNEHQGFGRMAADAKDRQRNFLRHWLTHPSVL
jgi:dienelactone hydrolase